MQSGRVSITRPLLCFFAGTVFGVVLVARLSVLLCPPIMEADDRRLLKANLPFGEASRPGPFLGSAYEASANGCF